MKEMPKRQAEILEGILFSRFISATKSIHSNAFAFLSQLTHNLTTVTVQRKRLKISTQTFINYPMFKNERFTTVFLEHVEALEFFADMSRNFSYACYMGSYMVEPICHRPKLRSCPLSFPPAGKVYQRNENRA